MDWPDRQRSDRAAPDRSRGGEAAPWYEFLRTPRGLSQAAILGGLVLTMLLVVQWPRPPLPVHKGEKTTHPILARDDFRYVDHEVTANVGALTALVRVPGLYSPDSRQVIALRDSLLAMVAEAAKVPALEQVPEAARTEWKVTPEMFAALKQAVGDEAANLSAVQEAVTKALAALAEPTDLGIVRDEDLQRAVARLRDIKDLRSKLPAGLSPEVAPIQEEPVSGILVILPAGEQPLMLKDVFVAGQNEPIQARIQRLIEKPLKPIFGDTGAAVLASVIAPRLGPTLVYDTAQTENRRAEAKAAVKPVPVLRRANTTLVEADKEITDADLKLLEQEQEAHLASLGLPQRALAWVGAATILALLILIQTVCATQMSPKVARSFPRSLILALLCLLVVTASKAVAQAHGPPELYTLLLVAAGMVVTIAYTPVLALALVWPLVFLVAIAARADLDWVITATAGTSVAILSLGEINNRSKLIRVGALAGLAFFAARAALAFWRTNAADRSFLGIFPTVLWPAFLYYCVGLAAGIILLALLPFIERAFAIVTNISLLELCDVNQPALRRLALEAPGTYTHSLLIGSLAEAAAEAIGANGLLARVGAYFHDIGKAGRPQYFVENWQDVHAAREEQEPHVIRQVIQNHVSDGLAMADRLGLPPVIKAFIAEHHGTTLIEYFYREAVRHQAAAGRPAPAEAEYRYPGPKPSSPESAIVMLADAAEGATRSLKERTAGQIGATVHEIVMKRLLDGQLDQSRLTLTDLRTVEETLTKTLLSVYHGRMPYPADRRSGETASAAGKGTQVPRAESGAGRA